MSDETKTKPEGDDEITLAMVNVWRSTMGRAPYTSSEWAKWPEERHPAKVALTWVRANLVAPAVAEAGKEHWKERNGIVALKNEHIAALENDCDKLRAWADEWNSKACALQHQLNLANDSLAAEKGRTENLTKGLLEANRLGTDYVGVIRELRAKVSALEATLDTPAPAALPKVGETVFMLPTAAVRDIAKPARVLYHWPSGRGFNSVDDDGRESPCRDTHEGINWSRTMPQEAPSEPPPEDVATHVSCPACGSFNLRTEPALREIRFPSGNLRPVPIWQDTCLVCGQVGDFADRNDALIEKALSIPEPAREVEDVATPALDKLQRYSPTEYTGEAMEPDKGGLWLQYCRVREAYSCDLAAAIARETERLRNGARWLGKEVQRQKDRVVGLLDERDDLRRQLGEHAGECAVCGSGLQDRSSFPWKGVRVCGDCAQQSQSKLEAAIDALRAGECAACGENSPGARYWFADNAPVCPPCALKPERELRTIIDARRAGK